MRKKALELYLEGLGFRSIDRILEVSNVTVLNWIRSFGEEVQSLQSESKEIEIVELDEMHSCIGNKKAIVRFGGAVDRYGKRFINFVIGDRNKRTARDLWKENKHHKYNSK